MLCSQLVLISQYYLHIQLKYNNLRNENYLPKCFTVAFACEKRSKRYVISFVDQPVGVALHPSFYCVLAFAK